MKFSSYGLLVSLKNNLYVNLLYAFDTLLKGNMLPFPVYIYCVWCVCVCLCMCEKEGKSKSKRQRQTDRERGRGRGLMCFLWIIYIDGENQAKFLPICPPYWYFRKGEYPCTAETSARILHFPSIPGLEAEVSRPLYPNSKFHVVEGGTNNTQIDN